MNAIGIALIWCIVQITLLGLLAAGLYLLVRRLRPAAAAPVVFSSLAIVVILSVLALSPWPRWTIDRLASSPLSSGEGPGVRASGEKTSSSAVPLGERQGVRASGEDARPPANNPQNPKTVETVDAEPAAAKTHPSSAAIFWRALVAELSNSAEDGSDAAWRWPAVVAVSFLAAMTCGLAWLVLGMTAVGRQRIRSRAVLDRELLELIDVLRAELGCLRAVEVRESDDLVTAATIGWRRPVVLLPADWRNWTPEQRQAVLAHEIFHARSHDFVALLFGQFGLMLHCYHPLLHWLMNRLRLEQELAADAAAASVSGGPRQYLSTIAELALQTQERRLSWPTRTFLPTRTTFLRRIAVLRDSKERFEHISPAARLTTVGVVLLFGLLVAGLRGPGQSSQAVAGDGQTTAKSADSKAPKPADTAQPAANSAKLRYGFQPRDKHCYNVKIAASLPDEEATHEGMLTYDILAANDDQFTLKCTGALRVVYKPKPVAMPNSMGPRFGPPPGMFGPPRIPGFPHRFGPGAVPMRPLETIFDRRGKIVLRGESPWLPFLLGEQVELVIERLPNEEQTAWNVDRELGVIERDQSGPFFGPFGPGGSETNRGAKEHIDYAVIAQDQDSIRISKKYSLKTAADQGVTHIDMSGEGELAFDKKLGVVKSEKMKFELRVNEQNIALTIPCTLDLRLMTAQEAAEQKKMDEQRQAKFKAEQAAREAANKPKPLAPGEAKRLLRELRAADEKRVQDAAKRLSKAIPGDNPTEFSGPLCAAYKHKNEWTQADLMAALRVWAGADAETTVIEASRHSSFMVRGQAIPALGKFKTAAAAEAAAAQASRNRGEVETAMKAMGPVAEPAAISLLQNSDIWIRATTANILAEIGGRKGLAALTQESRLHPGEVREVETAIVAIEKRLAESGPAADSDTNEANEEKAGESTAASMRIWHAAVGDYQVQAAFVDLKDDNVTLKRANGHVVEVPLEKLSKADQDYAKQQAKAAKSKSADPFE